jgi:hypothetical protein
MHFPEFTLGSSRLCRFRCLLSVAMDAGKRIVPEHDPQSGGKIRLQISKDHIQTPAIRALVVPILDQRIGGVLLTVHVVYGMNRKQEAGKVRRIHKRRRHKDYRCGKHRLGFNLALTPSFFEPFVT